MRVDFLHRSNGGFFNNDVDGFDANGEWDGLVRNKEFCSLFELNSCPLNFIHQSDCSRACEYLFNNPNSDFKTFLECKNEENILLIKCPKCNGANHSKYCKKNGNQLY